MTDRRGFFKELLREAAGVAQELSAALRATDEPEPEEWRPAPPLPAQPATGFCDVETLLELCRESGLERRAADVERTARVGLRLTPRADAAMTRSRLGGSPDVPHGFVWPSWGGRELAFLGQVDLAAVAAVAAQAFLPAEGLLLFFYDLATMPSGLLPAHRGSCRVLAVAGELETDDRRPAALRPLPVEVSRELMLPGAWSFQAEQLDLTFEERDVWDELRERLARAQGVELEETSENRIALHRLLGYHDELGREVEVECELASAGLDADDFEVYYETRPDREEAAREWRLLLQLSADESLGASDAFERLYVCARDRDLRAGRLDGAWAVCR